MAPKVHEIVSNLIEHSQKVDHWYIVAVESRDIGIIRPTKERWMDLSTSVTAHAIISLTPILNRPPVSVRA
jgi:hypothetical protein